MRPAVPRSRVSSGSTNQSRKIREAVVPPPHDRRAELHARQPHKHAAAEQAPAAGGTRRRPVSSAPGEQKRNERRHEAQAESRNREGQGDEQRLQEGDVRTANQPSRYEHPQPGRRDQQDDDRRGHGQGRSEQAAVPRDGVFHITLHIGSIGHVPVRQSCELSGESVAYDVGRPIGRRGHASGLAGRGRKGLAGDLLQARAGRASRSPGSAGLRP